jgi:hypothetical protein
MVSMTSSAAVFPCGMRLALVNLRTIIAFDRRPISLWTGAVGIRIALRTDQDSLRRSSRVALGIQRVAGRWTFRRRMARSRLTCHYWLWCGIARALTRLRNRFWNSRFVFGRAAWFNAGQCSSLLLLRFPCRKARYRLSAGNMARQRLPRQNLLTSLARRGSPRILRIVLL